MSTPDISNFLRNLPEGKPATESFSGPDARAFKRHEELRELAEKVLGVHIILTPSSDGVHIRAQRNTTAGRLHTSIHVDRLEIEHAKIDVVTLNILQAIKDVGGFNALH